MTKRKQRIDSAAQMVKVMAAASKEILPPAHFPLLKREMPFFKSVVSEAAKSEWTDHQLEMAAMLARTMSDLEREQRAFQREGAILISEDGARTLNKRKDVIQMHIQTIMSTRRSLALHARAQGGDARDIGKRSALAKAIERNNPLDDELLARPN